MTERPVAENMVHIYLNEHRAGARGGVLAGWGPFNLPKVAWTAPSRSTTSARASTRSDLRLGFLVLDAVLRMSGCYCAVANLRHRGVNERPPPSTKRRMDSRDGRWSCATVRRTSGATRSEPVA
jgi:hypothetical protein